MSACCEGAPRLQCKSLPAEGACFQGKGSFAVLAWLVTYKHSPQLAVKCNIAACCNNKRCHYKAAPDNAQQAAGVEQLGGRVLLVHEVHVDERNDCVGCVDGGRVSGCYPGSCVGLPCAS